jgi:hypothetical protein
MEVCDMSNWAARIHKTGSTVQIFDGKKMVREIKASSETFEPAEAQLFANALLKELVQKQAEQMTDTTAEPSIATKAEQHAESTEEVGEQATGSDVGAGDNDADLDDLQDEEIKDDEEVKEAIKQINQLKKVNASLKIALKKEQSERLTERKARRGLAIAQQMVINGSLENNYDVIRSKVAEIVDLETKEIERLERKVAGESEFESSTEARKEARRQQRLARINRLAAEECQEDGDEEEADQLDQKAEVAEKKASLCLKIAQDMEEKKDEDEVCEAQDEEVKEETKDDEDQPEDLEEKQDEEVKEDDDEDDEPEDLEKMDDEELKNAMNSSKKKVASKKVAQEEEVKEEPKVEEIKEEEKQDEEVKDEDLEEKKATARMYRRIASKHRKIAEKKEAQGDTAGADKEDELADDAEEKAEAIESELQDDPMAMEMGTDKEEAQEEEVKEDEKEVQDEEVKEEEKQDEEVKEDEKEVQDEEVKEEETEKTASVIEGFGFDKSASVEQNEFSGTSEVERLSSMWRGAPKD